ncbi:MAG: adenylosuccinate synthase [Candidatus Kerfeldbacteria bacterium]
MENRNNAVLGCQWGDEGKGKVVDLLCDDADIVARFQGGNNAGHTIVFEGKKYVLHLVPSGIFRPNTICVIGNGPVLDPFAFVEELDNLKKWEVDYEGRIFISGATNLILPYHKIIDGLREKSRGAGSIGTTKRGIGPAYGDKTFRSPVISIADLVDSRDGYSRLKDLLEVNRLAKAHLLDGLPEEDQIDWDELFKSLVAMADIFRPMMADISLLITEAYKAGKKIVFEGAQGAMLDVDLGTRPYVTSSHVITGGICTGLGIGPRLIGAVTGIIKAYTTRVGAGPFPTELFDETGAYLYKKGEEIGASTGRDRRCGWLDLVLLKHTCRINGVDDFALTKIDVLDGLEEIKVCVAYMLDGIKITEMPVDMGRLGDCIPVYETIPGWEGETRGVTSYEDLPEGAKSYIKYIIDALGINPSLISTGPDREETIILENH